MIVELVMPKAGLTMVEGAIDAWKVNEGDTVKKGDIVFAYENEKTTIDCESTGDGIIHLVAKAGDVVKVGEVVALLAESREEYETLCRQNSASTPQQPAAATSATSATAGKAATAIAGKAPFLLPTQAAAINSGHVKASGLARTMAKKAGIDLAAITGTGPRGRIVAKDVARQMESPAATQAIAIAEPADGIVRTTITGLRKAIAKNMHDSLAQMAQSTAITEVDVTDLMALREKFVEKQEALGIKITLNDLFVKASVKVLLKHPLLNATFDGSVISSYPYVNIGVAVGAESGLVVPVLRHAEKLTLTEISRSIKDIAQRAKEGKLVSGEQSGGTFTISNVGMFPIDCGTPIINPPQVGLFGFGRPVKKFVEYKGEFCGRTMMNIMLTFDHRVFDGLEVGRIMQDIKELIESPEMICA